MELPVLYKQGAHSTLVWIISFELESCELVTLAGTYERMKEGALTEYRRKVEVNQSGRSLLEQAELEMKSRWKEKTDDGYIENYADTDKLKETCMLATNLDMDKNQIKYFPVIAQPKLDGIRCLAYPKDEGKFFLRTREKKEIFFLNHIRKDLLTIHELILRSLKSRNLPPVYRLDGELYTFKIGFEKLNGIIRFSEAKGAYAEEDKIFYYIFDIDLANEMSYTERYEILLDVLGDVKYKSLDLIRNYKAKNKEDIKKYHDKFVKEGYEGVIIRKISEPKAKDMSYLRRRCCNILKYKEFVDNEFVIVNAKEGKGIEEGLIVWNLADAQGKPFACRPRGDHASRREMYSDYLKNPSDYIGRKYRVRYQGLSVYGTPRFPVGLGICADR